MVIPMALIVDSSVFIAASRADDAFHSRGIELLREISENGETLYITDHILDEVTTFLVRKNGGKTAAIVGKNMVEHYKIIFHDPSEISEVISAVEKSSDLSYCDALSVIKMKHLGINKIASFDSGFDKVTGIKRIK